jgi:hypothetical protein
MGANIDVAHACLRRKPCRFADGDFNHSCIVKGVTALRGHDMVIPDLRAGFANIIAALIADGISNIRGIKYIERGYAQVADKLASVGAALQVREEASSPAPAREFASAVVIPLASDLWEISRIGIIGGSGLYHIEGFSKQKWVKVNTPFGDPSDEFLTGKLAGRDVAFLPRHARGHRFCRANSIIAQTSTAMKKLGVRWIISVSAVGSLQAKLQPCEIVLPDQFLDRTKKSLEHTFFGRGIVAHVSFADPICAELRELLALSAKRCGAKRITAEST